MSRVGVSRTRHLSHSRRIRRRETHLEWRARRAEPAAQGGIGDTADATSCTFENGGDAVVATGHGLTTGDGPFLLSTTGSLPAELSTTQLYWAIVVDVNNFQLAGGQKAAANGSVIGFTDDGAGTHSFARATTGEAITEWNRQKNKPETIESLTDIDDL